MLRLKFSIIICTYNRSELLKKCLTSLVNQMVEHAEILVIDNNSPDDTKNVAMSFQQRMPNLKYVFEPKPGLSHARNRGIQETSAPWVAFLDDDIYVGENYVQCVTESINSDFDCIGGPYKAYSESSLPNWIPTDFESYQPLVGELQECNFSVPHGGNVIYKTKLLREIGGFNPNLGMKAGNIGYGEETELQSRMNKIGSIFGFHPKMLVFHYVRPEKLSLKWMLISKIANGRDAMGEVVYFGYIILFTKTIRTLFSMLFIRSPKNLFFLMIKPNFYFENFVLETVGYLATIFGYWRGKFKVQRRYK